MSASRVILLTAAFSLLGRAGAPAQRPPSADPGEALAHPSPSNGSQRQDEQGALPYDLAFDMREFLWSTTLAVARGGELVAYAVRQTPPDVNLDARFMPNGSPSSMVGARVLITDRRTGTTTDVCPGGNCWRPSWSPDAQALAFYSDRDGPPHLWIHDLSTGESRRVSDARIKAKLWVGDEAQWSPDGAKLYVPLAPATGPGAWLPATEPAADATTGESPAEAAVTVFASGSERDSAGASQGAATPRTEYYLRENNAAVAAVDVHTGAVHVLVEAEATPRPSVLRVSPTGRWISYLSVFKDHGITSQLSTIDLAVVPAGGGPVHVAATDLPLLDDYHRLNYSWHPAADRLVYVKDGQLWLIDLERGRPAPPRRLGEELGPLAPTLNWFTRDGRAVIVGTDPIDERGYGDVRPAGIAVVPLDGGRARRFRIDDGWLYQDILKADARTVWQPDGASITLLLTESATGERALVRYDIESGQEQVQWKGLARLANLTGGGGHEFIMGMYEDIATPPNVYRFDAAFAGKERVSHIDPRLDDVSVGSVEIFETTVPLHDGTLGVVRTAVLLPRGAKRGDRLPALVTIYPGSDRTQNGARFGGGSDMTVPNLLFTSRGFAVVAVHLKLGPNREAGNPIREMVDVLLPQVYRAAELGYIDPNRLAIGGQSFGGYGTASVVSGTNLFRAAIAVSGIYDLGGTYGHMGPDGDSFWIGWSEDGQARMGDHPWANLRRYIDNSPYYQADRIFTPMLLVHGTDDMAYHDAQKLFSALRRLDRPAQLASYAGQGHVVSNWSRANAVDAAKRMVEFLRRHL